jgi:membrane protein YdbS with pleckstrin-like domain
MLEGSPGRPDVIISKIFPSDQLFSKYAVQTIIVSLFLLIPTLVLSFWLDFLWFLLLGELVLLVLTIAFIRLYISSIWYRLTETEVEVHKGIVTRTHKIVPYRTMTNVDHKQGPFDRFFNMATVDIHTAGKSGSEMGPAEKLVGMIEGHEIRETLLERIRLLNPPNFLMASSEGKSTRSSPELLAIRNELTGLNQALEERKQ